MSRNREQIQKRWNEVERALTDIREGKVVDGCPVEREGELLAELDALEYEAGLIEYPRFDMRPPQEPADED